MDEKKEKRKSPFGQSPLSKPFSPFGKKRTREEIEKNRKKKEQEKHALQYRIDSGGYDRATALIAKAIYTLLGSFSLAKFYLGRSRMFNFMIVGASGTILSWFLYEGLFRPIFIGMPTVAFLGMVITTLCVFLWNYTWNEAWTFKNKNAAEIAELKEEIRRLKDEGNSHNST